MSRKFLVAYTKEFKYIVAGKNDAYAFCDQQIDLSSTGTGAITRHLDTAKHKKNASTAVENLALTQFLKPKRSSEDEQIAQGNEKYAQ